MTVQLDNYFILPHKLHEKYLGSYISLFLGCWNIDDSLVGQLTTWFWKARRESQLAKSKMQPNSAHKVTHEDWHQNIKLDFLGLCLAWPTWRSRDGIIKSFCISLVLLEILSLAVEFKVQLPDYPVRTLHAREPTAQARKIQKLGRQESMMNKLRTEAAAHRD